MHWTCTLHTHILTLMRTLWCFIVLQNTLFENILDNVESSVRFFSEILVSATTQGIKVWPIFYSVHESSNCFWMSVTKAFVYWMVAALQVVWDHHRIIKGIPSEDHQRGHTSLAAGYVCILCHESGDQWSWGSCVRVSVNTGNWPGATHWIRSADSITTIITDITVTIIPLLLVLAARPRHSKKNLVFTGARLMSNPRAIIVFVHFALNVPQYPGQYQ